jgi:hypothetical protein
MYYFYKEWFGEEEREIRIMSTLGVYQKNGVYLRLLDRK